MDCHIREAFLSLSVAQEKEQLTVVLWGKWGGRERREGGSEKGNKNVEGSWTGLMQKGTKVSH